MREVVSSNHRKDEEQNPFPTIGRALDTDLKSRRLRLEKGNLNVSIHSSGSVLDLHEKARLLKGHFNIHNYGGKYHCW